jgi:DUF3097, C-terminal domain/DUF3097, N-terminal domain
MYERDILDEPVRRAPMFPVVTARLGLVVEDRASGFCGDVVRITTEAVTLRDRHGNHRHFRWKPGGFLSEGRPVTLVRPEPEPRRPAVVSTASGSVALPAARARVARAARIWVEGRHDAELLEHVWGDDLRAEGVVVGTLWGVEEPSSAVARFRPGPDRRLAVLVDHLVPGSKEARLAAKVAHPDVLVTGTPFVDVWQAVLPSVAGIAAWPDVPLGVPWKQGVIAALGIEIDPAAFWIRLRNRVRSYADLDPALVGAVEQLIDFVTEPPPAFV